MKSAVICTSRRFKKDAEKFLRALKRRGVTVHMPPLHGSIPSDIKEWEKATDRYKNFIATGLTLNHFKKIKKADVTFVFNKGGYIGNSVTLEIGAAAALDKPIYALEHDKEERCRDILIDEIVKTPAALIKKLK